MKPRAAKAVSTTTPPQGASNPPSKPRIRVFAPIPDDTFDRILERISAGEAVLRACKAEGVTDYGRFYARLNSLEADAQRYARAKSVALDRLAQEILEIQDDHPRLVDPGGDSPGDPRTDSGWVQWQRNRVEARKWLLSKLAPKVYGDKLDATLAAPDGGPLQTEVRVVEGLDTFRAKLLKVLDARKVPPLPDYPLPPGGET